MSTIGIYGGSHDPCILGYTNGTYPNGTLGRGKWDPFGTYLPTSAEKQACQNANDPWSKSMYYGWWTTYFIIVGIVILSAVNGIKRLRNLNRILGMPSVIYFPAKLSAIFRMASYPQLPSWQGAIPSFGSFFLLFGFLLFSILVCFSRRPYYRPPNYGSSPLGLRSEFIATAMVPWLYATATKKNFLEIFTGVSFGQIMSFHKWAPWICLIMSLVHTCSMIIQAEQNHPLWYIFQNSAYYWNGFIPLVALAWLCIMSLKPIRARFYETFYVLHISTAIVFLVSMYIHLNNLLNTWRYLHAAVVLWGAAVAWRFFAYVHDHACFRSIPRASIEALPSNAIRICVPMPRNRTWGPGSHVYIRFLGLRSWQSHPFSISSLPARPTMRNGDEINEGVEKHQMVLVVRRCTGITACLGHLTSQSLEPVIRACLVDGPYGGLMDSVQACDTVLLLAGGSGMASIIPIAQALSRLLKTQKMSCCKTCLIHWSIRDSRAIEWFKDQLNEIDEITIYITGTDKSKKASEQYINSKLIQKQGRPNLSVLVKNTAEKYSGRLGVVVSGPLCMNLNARKAENFTATRK
ncbi:hypothetical protein O181_053080 [Austropuccinia psidii MF-1]|uniref:FAD-binding FR-type domain-containing protein n=1 Tax=Austropuccinia psidii MF-1 TaxID=1389203 RepID=A0A9Q3E666_9BASI|nr:hypothetical protein [Austropuccinia psidii MF-1]